MHDDPTARDGPYVITTRRRVKGDSRSIEYRRAAITPEDVRHAASEEVTRACGLGYDDYEFQSDAFALPESGGTVGPLPDGTVIEVTRVDWDTLAKSAEFTGDLVEAAPEDVAEDMAEIIAAFNARNTK